MNDIMENFFYNDTFYHDIPSLLVDLDLQDESDIGALEDDWSIEVNLSKLTPIVQLSADWICDQIDPARISEEGDEIDTVMALIEKHLDFSKVNELMPKLWYVTRDKVTITKADLLDEA